MMMNNLDDPKVYRKLDLGGVLPSLRLLPDQCREAWSQASKISFPAEYLDIGNIVISGMGGSTYGARIVKSLYDRLPTSQMPIELANGYWLPGFVNAKTLVILSSYSGNTLETLATARQAQALSAKISGITSGGRLAEFLKSGKYPSYIFEGVHNPSKQPRIGAGYMVMGLIGLLSALSRVPTKSEEVEGVITFLLRKTKILDSTVTVDSNPAKQLAQKLVSKLPVFIVADFLTGAAYGVRNPFHETAKQFALYFSVPELNHHLMEGLSFPKELKKLLTLVFVESLLYDKRNRQRLDLTAGIVEKNNINCQTVTLSSSTQLSQTMEFLQLGGWTAFYLSMLNNIDPAKIPWVDYFKKKLTNEK